MSIIYLGIGSNVGALEANLGKAVKSLNEREGIEILARSKFYYTEPLGGPLQDDYLNGVLKIETDISAIDFLNITQEIEKEMGRKDSGRNFPRVIDLDILFYDKLIIRTDRLIIPHPGAHKRYFVLKGLKEIAPDFEHPVFGEKAAELLNLYFNNENYNSNR